MAALDKHETVEIAREIVRAKIETEAAHAQSRSPHDANAIVEWLPKLDAAKSVPQIVAIEAQAAMAYWRAPFAISDRAATISRGHG
jgi:CRISPR/Cas system-associated endonuclease Cas1